MTQKRLDISSEPEFSRTSDRHDTSAPSSSGNMSPSRKFLGVQFECCSVYARIYVNREGTAYVGRCPRCLKPIHVKIGEGGTSQRFFKAQ